MAMRLVLGAMVAVALLAAAGCGGDDDGGSATETTTTETSVSGNERLTDEQWSEYQAAAETFVTARDAATEKLDECPDTSANVFSTCVGSALDDLETAATDLGNTLSSFTDTVSGQCQSDTAALITYVNPYVNAVQTLQDAIESGSVSEIPSAKTTLQTLTQGGAQERQAFEESCKPV